MKSTEEEFNAIRQKVDANIAETQEKIDGLAVKQKATRTKLDQLEKAFQAADIEGLTKKVDEMGVELSKIAEDLLKQGQEQEERIASLETGAISIRTEMSEIKPYCNATFSTKVDVKVLADKLELFQQEFITRKEFLEVQDDFHSQMTNFITTELNTQRMDIYHKLTSVQERLSAEIEEASKGEEVEMCVERLQAFTRDIEDLGQSVAQHNEAIEQSAFQIQNMGKEMVDELDRLKDNHGELNSRVEGVMAGMHATVKAAIDELSATSGFGGLLNRGPSAEIMGYPGRRNSNTLPMEFLPDGDDEDEEISERSSDSRPRSATWLQPVEPAGDNANESARSAEKVETEVEDSDGFVEHSAGQLQLVPGPSRPSTGQSLRSSTAEPTRRSSTADPSRRSSAADPSRRSSTVEPMPLSPETIGRGESGMSQGTQAGRGEGGTSQGTQAGRLPRAVSKGTQRRPSREGEAAAAERPRRRPSTEGGMLPGEMQGMLMHALANLQHVLEEQIAQMRGRMYQDFVPKAHHDNAIKGTESC